MERFKNRWVYALTALICSFTVLPLMGLLLGNWPKAGDVFTLKYIISQANFIGFPVVIAALICWPTRTTRTMNRMTGAGLLTVICTFLIIPLYITARSGKLFESEAISASVAFLIFGSIFTYGIPYIIAVFVSLAFVDHSMVETGN